MRINGKDTIQTETSNPEGVEGFTLQGSLEEWLTVADCYFEALAE